MPGDQEQDKQEPKDLKAQDKNPKPPKTPPAPPPPAKAGPSRWRLANEVKVSIGGGMTTLRAGTAITLQHHGVHGVERIKSAGGKLEPVGDDE